MKLSKFLQLCAYINVAMLSKSTLANIVEDDISDNSYQTTEPENNVCEPLISSLCQSLNLYNQTRMPNFLGQQSQQTALMELQNYLPLVKVQCSKVLGFFLCSVYAPICHAGQDSMPRPPCRSVCQTAESDCSPLMKKFGFSWPASLACNQFPEKRDSAETSSCLLSTDDLYSEEVSETTQPDTVLTRSRSDSCEPLSPVSVCRSLKFYNQTTLPNFFGHENQADANMALQTYIPLIKVNCSNLLKWFLCSVYAPVCPPQDRLQSKLILPCRSVCLAVKSDCVPVLKQFGFDWPESLACDQFLKKVDSAENSSCLLPTDELYSEESNEITQTGIGLIRSRGATCEPLSPVSVCRSLNFYNQTTLPNFFGHENQADANIELQTFTPLLKVNCSNWLGLFLCSLYAPVCRPLEHIESKLILPCRSVCLAAKSGCGLIMERFGFDWPESMACDQFPEMESNQQESTGCLYLDDDNPATVLYSD